MLMNPISRRGVRIISLTNRNLIWVWGKDRTKVSISNWIAFYQVLFIIYCDDSGDIESKVLFTLIETAQRRINSWKTHNINSISIWVSV